MEQKQITNPVKAIAAYCRECCLGSINEVKLCTATGCHLWNFRTGVNNFRKRNSREWTEEEREAARQKMKAIREKQLADLAEKRE